MMVRLDSIFPDLAERFRLAPPEHQRKAALNATVLAALSVGLEGEGVVPALEHLRRGGDMDRELLAKIERLATRLDDEYLRMDEDIEEAKRPEALRLFSKARAASALRFALSEPPGQLHEAIYEAITAVDDPAVVVGPVIEALQR
ncbi:hypothetical protein HUW62_03225 [Myxococcus sp. AM011]|uniref:hypothetical protein n=1 Tax=Myxococcus sp. AM011 TaxID=2745200 RepID=UPI0015962B92|nr:hypothetical protein [Myxococcus sp. AM011]NVJ20233.1 hypothetical protein [Myxococcus sp. AM011]